MEVTLHILPLKKHFFFRHFYYTLLQKLIFQLNGYEIQPGCNLKVNVSVANRRLYIGNLPKSKTQKDILEEFKKFAGNRKVTIRYLIILLLKI